MSENFSAIQEIFNSVSAKLRDAIYILSVSNLLTDKLAEELLIETNIANGDAKKIITNLKAYPIWFQRTHRSWALDNDVRDYAFLHLNGNTKRIQENTLSLLKTAYKKSANSLSISDQKDFEYQIARLSLKIDSEQESGVKTLRNYYEIANYYKIFESIRVINLFIDESIKLQENVKKVPEYLLSAYFMQGMYQYRKGNKLGALSYFRIVADNHSSSLQSIKDSAIAYHLIGNIWAPDREKYKKAEEAYRKRSRTYPR